MSGRIGFLIVVAAALLLPVASHGLANQLSVQATLLDADGNGLDGDFDLTFSLYDASTGGNLLWTETQTTVPAVNGFFDVVLGADVINPILGSFFFDNPTVFIAIKVEDGPGVPTGGDPELDRRPMTKVAAAFVANVANVALDSLALNGFAADQFLKLGDPLDQTNMPPNGLNEVSNELLSNQFVDEVTSPGTPKVVGSGIIDTIDFPNIGVSESLNVSVNVSTTSDLSQLLMKLTDPEGTQYTLFENGGGAVFAATFPNPTSPILGDLTTWVGKNPAGLWTMQVIDGSLTPGATLNAWSIKIQTLSNQKVQVKGNLIVEGTITGAGGTTIDGDLTVTGSASFGDGATIDGDLTVTGSASFGDGATISGNVTFTDRVDFNNGWCPDTFSSGERPLVVNGVCIPRLGGRRTFQSASVYCADVKADLCTDSQSRVLRGAGLLMVDRDGGDNANWTNSFAGDDSNDFRDSTGNTGDNHGPGNVYLAPCCYNVTPARDSDQIVGNSVRLIHKHLAEDATWDYASRYCTILNADLCSKAQYQVLRDNGAIGTGRVWANDHSDNDDGVCNSSIGPGDDNPEPDFEYGFACCATGYKAPESIDCPKDLNESGGVCWVKTGAGTWNSAVNDCDANGAQLCSISQISVLRDNSVLSGAIWSNSHSDNDSGNVNAILGSTGDNPANSSSFNYACCL